MSVRVLVVDDSAFARKVLREVLSRDPRIEVAGIARDGLEALERVTELRPDVVTLDLDMPHLDGMGVLAALQGDGAPRVVVTTAGGDHAAVVAALQAGAVDVVHKPTARATDALYGLSDALVETVLRAASARPRGIGEVAPPPLVRAAGDASRVVVVGASTGGPAAVTRLLAALPGELPAAVAVVVHLPPGYTQAFAERLDAGSALAVSEAHDGAALVPGAALVARAGMHLSLTRDRGVCRARLDLRPFDTPHRPAVDVLFTSAAEAFGAGVIAVVLTGMGDDGLAGARAVRARGGAVLAESASSCVVDGMPRAVREAGLADEVAPLEEMAARVTRRACAPRT